MKKLTLALVALAALLAATSIAVASRKPDHDEAVAITKAFKHTKLAGLNRVASHVNVVRIRISTVNPRYARANLNAKPRYRNTFQNGYGVARYRLVAPKRWVVIDVGSSGVGCGKVPRAVRKDLKLTCP